jgi:processive 1,2-diacylglycerol beta-glucosyltransferase
MNENDNPFGDAPTPQYANDLVRSIVYFSHNIDDAMAVLRILGPAEAAGIKVIRGVESGVVHFERLEEGELVVFQRDFARDLDSYEKIVSLARESHKPVLMDIDDLLFELPDDHPDRKSHYYSEALLPMLQAVMEVDLLTVATTSLRDYLLQYNQNIQVFPNYLVDDLWSIKAPADIQPAGDSITIGYMGGPTHAPDLAYILPVLEAIYKKYYPRVRFHFWGIEAPASLKDVSQVSWCPPKSYTYQDFASYFQSQTADIMIAPLVDTLFNSCKSCVKYLEYSAIGVPGVYSKVAPYTAVIKDGKDGMLASTHQEWEQALSRLIEDPDLRRKVITRAQEKIRKSWLLSQNAAKLSTIYESMLVNYTGKAKQLPALFNCIKPLIRQYYETSTEKNKLLAENLSKVKSQDEQLSYLNERLKQQEEQLLHLNEQLRQTEDEMIDYVLSTSWEITRPFRKISGKLKGLN